MELVIFGVGFLGLFEEEESGQGGNEQEQQFQDPSKSRYHGGLDPGLGLGHTHGGMIGRHGITEGPGMRSWDNNNSGVGFNITISPGQLLAAGLRFKILSY